MRVLGVDPGLTRCGLGVVVAHSGRRASFLAAGVARTSPDQELGERLAAISESVCEWLDEYRPDALALERVFAQHNLTTVMGTAQVSGVIMLAAAQRKIPIALHTPSEVKRAVTGYGGAQKQQVQTMVAKILRLEQAPKPADAADALALAICHLWRGAPTGNSSSASSAPTAAQQAWKAAEAAARRGGRTR